MPTMYQRNCNQCGKPYLGTGDKFCSRACQRLSQQKRVSFTCLQCGKGFERPASEAAIMKRPFCSLDCWYAYARANKWPREKGPVERTCVICNDAFTVKRLSDPKRFCSDPCYRSYLATLYSKPKVQRFCEWCGAEFFIWPGEAEKATSANTNNRRRARGRFCSRACKGAWIARYAQKHISQLEIDFGTALKARGFIFQPQYPIKGFCLDIAFPERCLAVEIDGEYWHQLARVQAKDARKDAALLEMGWIVCHVPEQLIRSDLEAAIQMVKDKWNATG